MRDPEAKNRTHAEALRGQGIEVVELDVTDSQSVDRAVAAVIAKAGRIDVLINNAGVLAAGVSEAFTSEQARALFDVNVIGLHRVTRAVLPHLRRLNDGLIINIGSVLGRITFPFFRDLWCKQVRGRSSDRQLPLRSLAARNRRRSGTTQRLPDTVIYQRDSASRHGAGGRVRHPGENPWCHVRAVQHHVFRA